MTKQDKIIFLKGCLKDYKEQLRAADMSDKEHLSEIQNCIDDIRNKLSKLK